MADLRMVTIAWKDEPDVLYGTWVMIDKEWTEKEDDDNVFFYFSTEEEYELAKKKDNDLEFWIVENTTIKEN